MSPILVGSRTLAVGLVALASACTGTLGPGGDPHAANPGKTTGPGPVDSDPAHPGPGGGPGPVAAATGVVPAGLRRLSKAEYQHTVRDLLGAGIVLPTELDRDDPDALFASVGGYRVTTSPGGVLKYDDAGYDIAHQVFADPARAAAVVGCDLAQGAACAASFVRGFGRKAWRRPLGDDEVARYTKVVADVTDALGTPAAGFEYGLAGLLQSPNFIYVAELGENDGGAGGHVRFTSYEMATRLSYLLLGSTPDAALATAADSGALVTPAGLGAEVDRLLASAAARPALIAFFSDLFGLGELEQLAKDPDTYPGASAPLFAAMREEVERLVGDTTLDRRGVLLDLFDVPRAFVNADLAKHYGLAAPAGAGFASVALSPASERAGVLTTGAWLSVQAKPTSSSPTLRGVFVREKLLCQDVPPPPPNVDNQLPTPADRKGGPPMTTRQVLEHHRTLPACASCHAFFDPIGVAFEHFDGVGAHRTTEEGIAIDTSGDLDGRTYRTLGELLTLLKSDPRVGACLARHAYNYASGHQGGAGEDDLVKTLATAFTARPDFRDLLALMLKSDWFRYPGAPL
jgi:hypothetical protein